MTSRYSIGVTIALIAAIFYIVYHNLFEHQQIILRENKTFTENIGLIRENDSLKTVISAQDNLIDTLQFQRHETDTIYITKIRSVRNLPPDSINQLLARTLAEIDSILQRKYNDN